MQSKGTQGDKGRVELGNIKKEAVEDKSDPLSSTNSATSSGRGKPRVEGAEVVLEGVRHAALALDHENERRYEDAIREYQVAIGVLESAPGLYSFVRGFVNSKE